MLIAEAVGRCDVRFRLPLPYLGGSPKIEAHISPLIFSLVLSNSQQKERSNIMTFSIYLVETTQVTIHVYASSKGAAIEKICNYELCPRSSILSVRKEN